MSARRSKTIDAALRRMWAKMAQRAAETAVFNAGNPTQEAARTAEFAADRAAKWADQAGADAIKDYFRPNGIGW